ncbi:MAG TPA: glycosyltransferase [Candidatus Kapabacteria bacterium]|nr:glycosyltransferase [Candidatus Kapabacteria bacterium]
MKRCHINNLFTPYAVGGAEQVVARMAKDDYAEGHVSMVISWRPWNGWGSWRPMRTEEEGVITYRFWVPNIASYRNLSRHGFFFKLVWHVIDMWNWWSKKIVQRILESERPEEVYTHNVMGIGYSIPLLVQQSGIRHVAILHDVQLVEPSGILPWNHATDTPMQKLYSSLMKRRWGAPDFVISPSSFLKEFYIRRGFFEKTTWVIRQEKTPKKDLKKPQNKVSFLFVGSLVPHKGCHILMDAWEKVQGNAELHIVGDGVLRPKVEAWVNRQKNVTYHGRLEKGALENIYAQCDVLLFPSICLENLPTVLVEAGSHGLFIIASRTGGTSELIEEKRGWLIEPENAEVLRKKIEDYIDYCRSVYS